VSPAAWSAFEQRVRARRADKAVAEARDAIGRGDAEAGDAALTELDAMSPGDSRRVGIEASLAIHRAERTQRRAPIPTVVAAGAPQRIDSVRPSLDLDLPLALNLEISPALEREIARAAESRPIQAPVLRKKRPWSRVAAASAVVAASGLLGFWVFAGQPAEWVSLKSGDESRVGDSTREPGDAPDAPAPANASPNSALPEVAQFDTAAPAAANPDATTPDPLAEDAGTLLNPSEADSPPSSPTRSEPLPGPTGTTLSSTPTATVRRETTDAPPPLARPGVAPGMPGPSTGAPLRPVDRPADVAHVVSSPLEVPVQSEINTPDTRPAASLSASEPLARVVPPVPAPPAAVIAAPTSNSARGVVETGAVRGVLDSYAEAFSALDANATQRVWPGVDLNGLRRAFDQLNQQTITFNRCDVNASGQTAEAVCVGRATWVPKVGDRSPKSEPRTWKFALGRDEDGWVIDRVQVQR
jgi:hypothetical protein